MAAALDDETALGRADDSGWVAFLDSIAAVRASLGRLVGATSDEIALTHHTTEGLDLVLWGMDWVAGDRIALTSLEHDAGVAAVHTIARRLDLEVEVVECGDGDAETVLGDLARVLEQRPRLLLVSHVAYGTGAVLPIAEIAAAAHAVGTAVLVDGAQAVGAIDVDVAALGADFYAFNGYKWLCGPEGFGALVVRESWIDRLLPSFGGAFGVTGGTLSAGDVPRMQPAAGAARYESGSWFRPGLTGMRIAADLSHDLTADGRGTAQVAQMARLLAVRLVTELGAVVATPVGRVTSGLVAFEVPGLDARSAVRALEADGVIVRAVPGTNRLRASCAAFIEERDLDALLAALARLVDETSRSLQRTTD